MDEMRYKEEKSTLKKKETIKQSENGGSLNETATENINISDEEEEQFEDK